MRERRSAWQIWRAPVLLALLSAGGLIAGLLGEGLPDVVSWVGLTVPVAICVWALWLRS